MTKTFLILAIAAGLTTPAMAQGLGRGGMGGMQNQPQGQDPAKAEQERREKARQEEAYRRAMKNIPDAASAKSADPWKGAR